jgi:hypothetical protein
VKPVAGGARPELVGRFPDLAQTRGYLLAMGADGRVRAPASSNADRSQPTAADGKFSQAAKGTPGRRAAGAARLRRLTAPTRA